MASLNKAMLLGNLGQDVELRHTGGGTAVCNLSVATTDRIKDSEGNYNDKTEWHKVICFGKTAENCSKYLSKGRTVFVEGKIQTRSWEDKDGVKKYSTEVLAQSVNFIGGGKDENKPKAESKPQQQNIPNDDVPF